MQENGIAAAFNALGDKINQLECEIAIQKHLYADMQRQKEELEAELAKVRGAQNDEDRISCVGS